MERATAIGGVGDRARRDEMGRERKRVERAGVEVEVCLCLRFRSRSRSRFTLQNHRFIVKKEEAPRRITFIVSHRDCQRKS
jgi:hypothetical protein